MVYDEKILCVLVEAGIDGLSVKKIAHHVFNGCNTLFTPIQYEDVYEYTRKFVYRNSRSSASLLIKGPKRGIYLLNPNSVAARQLQIEFNKNQDQQEQETKLKEDKSLMLF